MHAGVTCGHAPMAKTKTNKQTKKKTDDRYIFLSFIVIMFEKNLSFPYLSHGKNKNKQTNKKKNRRSIYFFKFYSNYVWKKPLLSLPFAGKNASRVLCLYLPFGAFLDLDLQKHTAKTLFATKEQGSYSKRMQPSLSFVLHYDTSSSWIFRKTEQYGKEIMYLAVMFLTLNNQYQKHIIPMRVTSPYVLRTMLGFFSRRSRPIRSTENYFA